MRIKWYSCTFFIFSQWKCLSSRVDVGMKFVEPREFLHLCTHCHLVNFYPLIFYIFIFYWIRTRVFMTYSTAHPQHIWEMYNKNGQASPKASYIWRYNMETIKQVRYWTITYYQWFIIILCSTQWYAIFEKCTTKMVKYHQKHPIYEDTIW